MLSNNQEDRHEGGKEDKEMEKQVEPQVAPVVNSVVENKPAKPSETFSWKDALSPMAALFKFIWKLIKSIVTSMPISAVFFLLFSVITGGEFYMFHGSINHQFDSLFNERYTSTNPVCYGREEFKRNLKMLVDSPNPKGVIFVSGAKNSGKTTSIKSALQGRRHVTYINLRYKTTVVHMLSINRMNQITNN